MSVESFKKDLIRAAGTDGSHLTRESRERIFERFADFCYSRGFQLHQVSQIKDKHIHRFIQERLGKVGKRTCQNEMSAIRKALIGGGREKYAIGPTISNTSLKIDDASRAGTKLAMPADLGENFITLAKEKDEGVAACLDLQRTLGLREKEALMSFKSLRDWENQLMRPAGSVIVSHGTKGGRARTTFPIDRTQALTAVRFAREVVEKNGGRLVNRDSLKQALDRYSRVCASVGMKGVYSSHSYRYAFAIHHIKDMMSVGISKREALAITSQYLGHGDGRGRWVEMVYARELKGTSAEN